MRSKYNLTRNSREDRSPIAARAIARMLLLVGLAGLASILCAGAALAFDEVDYEVKSKQMETAQKSSSIELRPTGIAHVELPLGFRARFDATATRNLYRSEDLAEAFNAGGPQLRYRRSLESRVSLSRALTQNMEFEIAWGARSPIQNVDLLNFQRQTFGALLRIVH